MKTDQLVEILSTSVEPVRGGQLNRTLALALVAGGVAAFCLMLSTVGLRSGGSTHLVFVAAKLLFTSSLIGIGAALLSRLARPGQSGRRFFRLLALPFLIVGLAGAIALGFQTPMAWGRMLVGMNWMTCLFCIPLFAIVPFICLVLFLRRGAPTDLRKAGATAGLVAGALGATAYAFHCPDDSVPFVAVWYAVMIGLCAFVGSRLGPRLLRW